MAQIPAGWYTPKTISHIRDINGTRHDVSLKAVIEAQLEKDPVALQLPRYLLVMFQLSL